MNVLIVSCVFPPEPVISAKTSFDVAEMFHDKGWSVSVAAPLPNRNVCDMDKQSESMADKFFNIHRLFSIKSSKSSLLSRFAENISFGLSVFFFVLKSKNVDLIYSNVWPIFSSGFLVLAAKLKKIKVITSVQDLYPESLLIQNRLSKKGLLYSVFMQIDRYIARNSHHVIVISEDFKNAYINNRYLPENRVTVIKNWVRNSQIQQLEKHDAQAIICDRLNISLSDDDFLVVYGGNMGVASGLERFVRYIDKFDENIKFLFAGAGSQYPVLQKYIRDQGWSDKVYFLSPWLQGETSQVLCSADLLLLPIAEGQEFASVPSKLITYMLSSRPIMLIANNESESAKEIRSSGAGVVVNNWSESDISSVLHETMNLDKNVLNDMGSKGRSFADKNYSFTAARLKFDSIIESIYVN